MGQITFRRITKYIADLLTPSTKRRRDARRTVLGLDLLEDRLVPASPTIGFAVTSDWQSGFGASMSITNNDATAVNGWKLEFDFDRSIDQIWNATIVSHVGAHYTVKDVGYNATIGGGKTTSFGFNGSPGNVTTKPTNYIFNGMPVGANLPSISITDVALNEGNSGAALANFTVTLSAAATQNVTVAYATRDGAAKAGSDYTAASGTLTFTPGQTSKSISVSVAGDTAVETDEDYYVALSGATNALILRTEAKGTIVNDDQLPAIVPTISISDVQVTEGNPSQGVAAGYFRTSGNQIVDANGKPIRLAGVNWFGMESTNYAPHGLWTRGYKEMMDQMKQLGFNVIRLPYANQLFDAGSTPNGIDFSKNADLSGLTGAQILDKIVDYAGKIGMRIILDHHRSDAGAGAELSGLWYTSKYSETRWINDWTMLATRYANNPTVIGADLHNEPHGPATWGTGGANDWRLAAERAGNAILAANPNWLILVEGIETAKSGGYWWGGNLSNAGDYPVRLNVAGRLVYSPHDYPSTIYEQKWFSDPTYPNNLPAVWDAAWGYLYRQGTAPILLGEFGTKLQTASDIQWLDKMVSYIKGDLNGDGANDLASGQLGISWTWWSWNPNSGDTGGILQDDWRTVHQAKMDKLTPVEFPFGTAAASNVATFTVSLSQATSKSVTINYSVADGTATAGQDYQSASGTLTFAPGETQKTISVSVLPDAIAEPNETFFVRLATPVNATVADGEGQGTILDDDAATPTQPSLSIADLRVTEGNSGTSAATFTVRLSAAATNTITVAYSTQDQTALAGSDYQAASGTLTFAPGETQKTVTINVTGDTAFEPDETFLVKLATPTNATLGTSQAVGTIANDDAAPPPLPSLSINSVSVTEGNSGTVTATLTINLSQAATGAVTVQYATADETAKAGSDYVAKSGTVAFAAGQTQQTVTVAVNGDTAQEGTETFVVGLSAASGATISNATGRITIVDNDAATAPTFNYGEAVQKAIFFYNAERSGDLPDNFEVAWRGDSGLQDGADVGIDLTGGFHDAGDHVKFGLPMTSSMTMLIWGLIQYKDAYQRSGQLDRMVDMVKWGTDWIMKAHTAPNEFYAQLGRGDLDHAAWVPPEVMKMARPSYKIDAMRPGSDVAAEAAAALASASIAFRGIDVAYADKLLLHARQLYNFADTYRGKYSDSITDAASYYNSYSGYNDELTWGGLWLYKATGEQTYLDKAIAVYDANFKGQTMTWTQSWDDKRYGAVVLLAQITGKAEYKADAERYLDYWSVGINGGANRIKYTPGGLAFLNGWGSLRYAASTAFVALVYADTVRDYNNRYHDFAKSQIDYILGNNPNQRSYMVGFGVNPPLNPHHRAGSGVWDGNVDNATPNRHILYGALVGGPESADDLDYHDVRGNYISNEVALDYNAGFTGALARLYMEYGGQPLASFPTPEVKDREFFVEGSVNQQGSTFTEVRALLNNRSAWPARSSSNLGFRYFVDLTETYAAGYSVNDVEVKSYYANGSTQSGLQAWDAAKRIYYVDVSFAGVEIVPGSGTFRKEMQLRIGLKNGIPAAAWDPTNDWSFQGLSSNRDALAPTDYMPVYEALSKKLGGLEPAGSVPGLPRVSVTNASVVEGSSGTKTMSFTLTLSAASTSPVTVAYATVDGTAKAGLDYTAMSGTMTFAAGTTSMTLLVPILGDTLVEGNEAFTLQLSNPTNAALAVSQATGTITDDDAPPAGPVTATFKVNDNWGTGYVASMTIRNNQTTAINGWTMEFDLATDIVSIWNAVIVSKTGNHYVIRAESWNGTIASNAEVAFGWQGAGNVGSGPSNIKVNGVPV